MMTISHDPAITVAVASGTGGPCPPARSDGDEGGGTASGTAPPDGETASTSAESSPSAAAPDGATREAEDDDEQSSVAAMANGGFVAALTSASTVDPEVQDNPSDVAVAGGSGDCGGEANQAEDDVHKEERKAEEILRCLAGSSRRGDGDERKDKDRDSDGESAVTVDLWHLRSLALSPGGYLRPDIRRSAWPKLVSAHQFVLGTAAVSVSDLLSGEAASSVMNSVVEVAKPCPKDLAALKRDATSAAAAGETGMVWHVEGHIRRNRRIRDQRERQREEWRGVPRENRNERDGSRSSGRSFDAREKTRDDSSSSTAAVAGMAVKVKFEGLVPPPSPPHSPSERQQPPKKKVQISIHPPPSPTGTAASSTSTAHTAAFVTSDEGDVDGDTSGSSSPPTPLVTYHHDHRHSHGGKHHDDDDDEDGTHPDDRQVLGKNHRMDGGSGGATTATAPPGAPPPPPPRMRAGGGARRRARRANEGAVLQSVASSVLRCPLPLYGGAASEVDNDGIANDHKNCRQLPRYYPGLADVAAILLIHLESPALASLVLRRVAEHHLRDAFTGGTTMEDSLLLLSASGATVRASLPPLLREVDAELHDQLFSTISAPSLSLLGDDHDGGDEHGDSYADADADADADGGAAKGTVTEERGRGEGGSSPSSSLSSSTPAASREVIALAARWTSTWFVRDVPDPDAAGRLVDLFIASHPLMPVYVAVALLTCPANRGRILAAVSEDDSGTGLRAVLERLPLDTMVLLPSDAKDHAADCYRDASGGARGSLGCGHDVYLDWLEKQEAKEEWAGGSVKDGEGRSALRRRTGPVDDLVDAALSHARAVLPSELPLLARDYHLKFGSGGETSSAASDHVPAVLERLLRRPPSWSVAPAAPTDGAVLRMAAAARRVKKDREGAAASVPATQSRSLPKLPSGQQQRPQRQILPSFSPFPLRLRRKAEASTTTANDGATSAALEHKDALVAAGVPVNHVATAASRGRKVALACAAVVAGAAAAASGALYAFDGGEGVAARLRKVHTVSNGKFSCVSPSSSSHPESGTGSIALASSPVDTMPEEGNGARIGSFKSAVAGAKAKLKGSFSSPAGRDEVQEANPHSPSDWLTSVFDTMHIERQSRAEGQDEVTEEQSVTPLVPRKAEVSSSVSEPKKNRNAAPPARSGSSSEVSGTTGEGSVPIADADKDEKLGNHLLTYLGVSARTRNNTESSVLEGEACATKPSPSSVLMRTSVSVGFRKDAAPPPPVSALNTDDACADRVPPPETQGKEKSSRRQLKGFRRIGNAMKKALQEATLTTYYYEHQ